MKPRLIALIVVLVLTLVALATPVHTWFGGPIEPYILGLPFFFGWTVVSITVAFLAMLLFHITREADSE